MRILVLLFSLIGATLAHAQTVTLEGTQITFDTPETFQPLSKAMIEAKWPARRAPRWVFANESTATSIAYDVREVDISQASLSQVMDYMKKTMSRIGPGINWIDTQIMEIQGTPWVYLEFTSKAINADIHNIMLINRYQNKMVVFNFNSTKDEFPVYQKALRASINSIQFTQ